MQLESKMHHTIRLFTHQRKFVYEIVPQKSELKHSYLRAYARGGNGGPIRGVPQVDNKGLSEERGGGGGAYRWKNTVFFWQMNLFTRDPSPKTRFA